MTKGCYITIYGYHLSVSHRCIENLNGLIYLYDMTYKNIITLRFQFTHPES